MNVTVYPKALRFIVRADDAAVNDLHKQYLDLVELLADTTVTVEACDFIIETVLQIVDQAPILPEYSKVFVSQVGDSLVFVFIKDRTAKGKRIVSTYTWERKHFDDWSTLQSVYAVIFTGLSNLKQESSDDK